MNKVFLSLSLVILLQWPFLAQSNSAEKTPRAAVIATESHLPHLLLAGHRVILAAGVHPGVTAGQLHALIPHQSDNFLAREQRNTLRMLRARALENDVVAQEQLADCYLEGQQVEQSSVYALAWFAVAAYQQSAYAQNMLAIFLREGQFIEVDLAQALAFQQLASTAGDTAAMALRIAKRSLVTDSVFYSPTRARWWLEKAAAQELVEAQLALGDYFFNSAHQQRDPLQALRWYGKAVSAGNPQASYEIARLFLAGEVSRRDENAGFSWMFKAAQKGVPEAQHYLGLMYEQGIGVAKSPVLAYAWYKLAARYLESAGALNQPALQHSNALATGLSYQQQYEAEALYQQLAQQFNLPTANAVKEYSSAEESLSAQEVYEEQLTRIRDL